MKTIILALVVLLASVNALPPQVGSVDNKDSRFIEEIVNDIIQSIINIIKDPTVLERGEREYVLNDETSAKFYIENFLLTGASNINVNDISFSNGVLSVDLSAPRIAVSASDAGADVTVRGRNVYAQSSGSLAINDLRAVAEVSLGLSGYILEDLKLSCSLGGIDSNVNLSVMDRDISDGANRFIGETLPNFLNKNEEVLNRIVAWVVLAIFGLLS